MTHSHALHATRHDTNDRALITLVGEIDLHTAPVLREALARCLHDGVRTIDVDLGRVSFCDCSGVNVFLTAALATTAASGTLRLHHPGPSVARLFRLTGSDALFRRLPAVRVASDDLLACAA